VKNAITCALDCALNLVDSIDPAQVDSASARKTLQQFVKSRETTCSQFSKVVKIGQHGSISGLGKDGNKLQKWAIDNACNEHAHTWAQIGEIDVQVLVSVIPADAHYCTSVLVLDDGCDYGTHCYFPPTV
jgi:hypothetical protein